MLIGADSRTTMVIKKKKKFEIQMLETKGAYIASRASDKIEYLHDRIFCLKSGVSSHT